MQNSFADSQNALQIANCKRIIRTLNTIKDLKKIEIVTYNVK